MHEKEGKLKEEKITEKKDKFRKKKLKKLTKTLPNTLGITFP